MQQAERIEVLGKLLRVIGDSPKTVYAPSDDTYLMLEAVAKLLIKGKRVLDLGTGSGIIGLFCASFGARVTVTDVDETALLQAQKAADVLGLNIEPVLSDLFSNVQGQFDVVIFNPPYLPSLTVEDRTVDGGQDGLTLSSRFLDGLPSCLKRNGAALLLMSSLNRPESLIAEHPEFQFSVAATRALFYEELEVLSVRFRNGLAS